MLRRKSENAEHKTPDHSLAFSHRTCSENVQVLKGTCVMVLPDLRSGRPRKQTNQARYWTRYAPGPGATHKKELIFLSQSGVSVG